MTAQVRQMQPNDTEQLHAVYKQFTLNYVGSASRDLKAFQRMTRKKDNLRWVALDDQGKVVGYIIATYFKGRRTGAINEIIVAPENGFEAVARPLIDKIYDIFLEKGAALIYAAHIRNPYYPRIFSKIDFFEVETYGAFMYTVTDVAKFLNEISPIIANRLKQLSNWNGLLQIAFEENSKFFKKDGETVQTLYTTNNPPDCKIALKANTLANILLGVTGIQEALKNRTVTVETRLGKERARKLLSTLFPRKQFLAFDYW